MRVRAPASAAGGDVTKRSIPDRNAASVLPDPVGARIRVCSPRAMAGQPWSWAAVGHGKFASNQDRTGSEKASSGIPRSVPTTRDRNAGRGTHHGAANRSGDRDRGDHALLDVGLDRAVLLLFHDVAEQG